MRKLTIPEEEYMLPGHTACLGCGATIAMRYVLKALGKNTVFSIPACCWAVIPGVYPHRTLEVPLLYTAFEVTGAAISGIREALDVMGKEDVNVVGFAGDGGTADIGLQALSAAMERGHNVFYIMYDNEAYMNTGVQRSGSTPMGAWTTTTPGGKKRMYKAEPKKNVAEIMVAHHIPYVATATIAYPEDMIAKLRRAKEIKGPKFIQIFSPCPTGWRHSPDKTVEISRLAVQTNFFPLYEVIDGKYRISIKPKNRKPIKEFFKLQGRFRHLTDEEIENIQQNIDANWEALLKKERCSQED